MSTCLVTGGAGFLGSHLCDELLAREPRDLRRQLRDGLAANIEHIRDPERFVHVGVDIIEPYFVEEPVDFVYHLASPASPIDYLRLPLHTLKVGSYGTHHTLGLAKAKRARFLLASTSEVYGDPQEHPQPESYWGHVNPIGPRGVYDEAKRYAEALTMAYHRQQGVDTAIVRIFNTYGSACARTTAARSRRSCARRWPTADDRVRRRQPDALVLLRLRPDPRHDRAGRVRLAQPVNIGNPTSSRCSSSPDHQELTGSSSEIVYEALPVDDPKQRKPDITLARELLGWSPR
jgi:dTDP-glucose 4,6-dehydratase